MLVRVEELRAHIVKLDTEIVLQRKLLRELKNDRTVARRQLNELIDPVARLPLEISSGIFLHCAANRGVFHASTLFMSICSTWAVIALSTPALWTTVHIDFPCAKGLRELLPLWFQRAGNHPMSVSMSLRGPSNKWDHSVSDIIWRHGGQLKRLEMTDHGRKPDCPDDSVDDDDIYIEDYRNDYSNMDFLGTAIPAPLLLLETLIIRALDSSRLFLGAQVLELLSLAPNIVECLPSGTERLADIPEPYVLPKLRRLMLGERDEGEAEILYGLSLPALEALSLPMRSIYHNNFLDFFRRSAPPLRNLALGWKYHRSMEFPLLHECFRVIPRLARFTLWRPDSQLVAELFAALADSQSLLPRLSGLTVIMGHAERWVPSQVISDSAWRILLGVVSTRRIQLHIVPIELPSVDVMAAFRQLVDDGLDIYIGTEEHNCLVS
ncbi:hypothetical protein C8R45DRAFT_1161560 [Mycena sanguinolenta]|nr:hypothetical protein C8R45DRAFT_1161560 [Mycena sanguinolenta]